MGNTVKFGSNKKTKTIQLPSYFYENEKGEKCNDTEVVIKTSRTMAEQRELVKKYPHADDPKHEDAQKSTLEMMKNAIVSWNFTDEEDKPLEISEAFLDQFDDIDFLFLLGEITGQELVKDGKILAKDKVSAASKNA